MPRLEETVIENREMVQPNDTNNLGTAHGGNVMKWMDEVGAMSAIRFAGESVVTARMDGITFTRPVPLGETALLNAYVYRAGRTSVRVRIRAACENPRTGETEPTTDSYAVYVAIDDEMEPVSVPDITVETEEERCLRSEALDGESELER